VTSEPVWHLERLRAMTGHEEEWVERRRARANTSRLCNEVLARCLVPPGAEGAAALERVRALPVAQRDAALLQLRRLSLGDTVQTQVRCPACLGTVSVDFPLSGIPLPSTASPERVEARLEDGSLAVLRMPTAGDQEALLDGALETESQKRTRLLARVLLRLGEREGPFSEDFTRDLPTPVRAGLERALEAALPDLDLSMAVGCPGCGHAFSAPFDVPAFFFAEMSQRSQRVLHDVHRLASRYHWGEGQILALTLARRRAYLRFIEAEEDRRILGALEEG
jgi:hypothetical protein